MKEKNIFAIILIALLLCVGIYFFAFNGKLSSESQEWSNFATYISGIMMIVLTSINIYVFIKLTKAIDSNDDVRRSQKLKVQKLILLSNFRQNEINRFNEILNNALMVKTSLSVRESINSIIEATTYIESFVNTKKHIFPFIEEKSFESKIAGLHKVLSRLENKWLESFQQFEVNDNDISNKPLDIKKDILEFLTLKNDVLRMLQEFTINNLKY